MLSQILNPKPALGTEADTRQVAKALCSMSGWPGPQGTPNLISGSF